MNCLEDDDISDTTEECGKFPSVKQVGALYLLSASFLASVYGLCVGEKEEKKVHRSHQADTW